MQKRSVFLLFALLGSPLAAPGAEKSPSTPAVVLPGSLPDDLECRRVSSNAARAAAESSAEQDSECRATIVRPYSANKKYTIEVRCAAEPLIHYTVTVRASETRGVSRCKVTALQEGKPR